MSDFISFDRLLYVLSWRGKIFDPWQITAMQLPTQCRYDLVCMNPRTKTMDVFIMSRKVSSATRENVEYPSPRISRRAFDREAGIVIAKDLFHERGYDAVGIAELTRSLGINPPSLYAAYGNKAGLFAQCLAVYVQEANLPADRILTGNRPLPREIYDLLMCAAALYTRSKTKRGCMAAEGMRANDPEARALASAYGEASATFIENYIRHVEPRRARELADYVVTTLQGLSAAARAGLPRARLLSVARLAGQAFESFLQIP